MVKIPDGDWKAFVVRSIAQGTILAACVVGAMHVAHAWEGRSGVEARSFFTVAGTLAGVPASPTPTLRFTFHKVGETTPCPPIDAVMVTYNGTTFSAQVPYDACGRGYFDGANITVDVAINGTPVVTGQAVNPVPYAHFASVAGQVSVDNDCPTGYAKSTDAGDAPFTVCRRTLGGGRFDEVVKVGFGASAFWIDRYEASVWDNAATTGMRLFRNFDSTSADFPKSGQWRTPGRTSTVRSPLPTPPAYAWSIRGVMPSSTMTWFQAQEACAASGKGLPTRDEWLRAAQGTEDPGDVPWTDGSCRNNINVLGNVPRDTGLGMLCRSGWGAQDMIGNVWEWTDEWYASVGQADATTMTGARVNGRRVNDNLTNDANGGWPSDYGSDGTWNISSVVSRAPGQDNVIGIPAAAVRGGSWAYGIRSGIFALQLLAAPSIAEVSYGFRCVVRQ